MKKMSQGGRGPQFPGMPRMPFGMR
jgi:hypothetical protein